MLRMLLALAFTLAATAPLAMVQEMTGGAEHARQLGYSPDRDCPVCGRLESAAQSVLAGAVEPYGETIHRALMRARVAATPGERHPNTDDIQVVVVDGLNRHGGNTGEQVSGLAFPGEMLIRVNRQRLDLFDDPTLLEDLVYHEFAHLIDGEPGHGTRWMATYMGLVERWLPEHAEVRWNNVTRKYKDEADADMARVMLQDLSLHELLVDNG